MITFTETLHRVGQHNSPSVIEAFGSLPPTVYTYEAVPCAWKPGHLSITRDDGVEFIADEAWVRSKLAKGIWNEVAR